MKSFTKIYREIVNEEFYKNIRLRSVYIDLSLRCSWENSVFKGVPIKPGQIVTSYPSISHNNDISYGQARGAIKDLVAYGKISYVHIQNFLLITILDYQPEKQPSKIKVEEEKPIEETRFKELTEEEKKQRKVKMEELRRKYEDEHN